MFILHFNIHPFTHTHLHWQQRLPYKVPAYHALTYYSHTLWYRRQSLQEHSLFQYLSQGHFDTRGLNWSFIGGPQALNCYANLGQRDCILRSYATHPAYHPGGVCTLQWFVDHRMGITGSLREKKERKIQFCLNLFFSGQLTLVLLSFITWHYI